MIKNILVVFLVAVATACSDSDSSGGSDQVATQCLAFGTAVSISGGFRHSVFNTCKKKINVLESSTLQRFSLDSNESQDVVLFSEKPLMGACFSPFQPELKGDTKQFECKRV